MTDEVTQSIQNNGGLGPRQSRFGKFQLIRKLGQGAFGVVYLAKDTELDREIALKIPKASGLATPERRKRFIREARAAAKVDHANICSVYEIGEVDGQCFIAMQLIHGRTLSDVLQSQKRVSPNSAAKLIRRLALALAEAHQSGVVHRDLKPANIMVNPKGQPVIMDFGLARLSGGADPLTVQGQILGTPAYMSPEQARGDSLEVDASSDIFSLGIVFYELLCGQRPYTGSVNEIIGQLRDEDFSAPSPALMRPELDIELVEICQRAIAHHPSQRIGSMKEFAALLTQYLKDQSASSSTSTDAAENQTASQLATLVEGLATETRLQKQIVKRWTLAIVATAIVLLAVGIAIALRPPATRSVVLSPLNARLRTVIAQDDIRVLIDDQEVAKDYLINGDPIELEVGTEHLVQIYRGDRLIRQQTFQVTADSGSIPLQLPQVENDVPDEKTLIAKWLLDMGGAATICVDDGTAIPLDSAETVSRRDFRFVEINLRNCPKLTNGQLANLTEVVSLEALDLSNNLQINDSGILHLDHLTTLTSIDLSKTNCADLSLVHLRQNANLESLSLAESQISDRGISPATSFSKLQSLDLSGTNVGDEGIASLPNTLTDLNLSGVTLGNSGWEKLGRLTLLQSLNVTSTSLRDDDLMHLGSLTALQHLDLSHNEISDAAIPFIARLTNLQTLSLQKTAISNPSLKSLSQCKHIIKLNLSETAASTTALRELSAFPNLTELQLADTSANTSTIGTAIGVMNRLETLNLRNTNVDTKSVLRCGSSDLKHIDITGTYIDASGSQQLEEKWPDASIVHEPTQIRGPKRAIAQWALSNGGEVRFRNGNQTELLRTDQELPTNAEIVELNMSDCDVDDLGCEILANLSDLESISFSGTDVSGETLAFLAASKSTLRSANFRGTNFTDEQLRLLDQFHQLETLDVRFTPVTGSGFSSLGQSKIQTLLFGGNEQVEPNIEATESLSALADLTVHNTSISVFSRDAIRVMQRLRRLKLADATDAEQPRIALLKSLKEYDLSGTNVSDDSLAHLASMTSLQSLNLSKTAVQGIHIDKLGSARALQRLDLSGLALNDSAVDLIVKLTKLESLNVAQTIVDNRHLKLLGTMRGLRSVDVRATRITSEAARKLSRIRPEFELQYDEFQDFPELEQIADHQQRKTKRRELTHRRAATWMLKNGGHVLILQNNGNRLPLTPQHRLPAGPISVVGVSTPKATLLNAFDDKAMRLLQGIDTLESFQVVSENISDAGIANLQGITSLSRFDVAKSPLTDRSTTYLAAATGLLHFRVADSKMSGTTIENLSVLPHLKYLGVPITNDNENQRQSFDRALATFKPTSKLSVLELSFIPQVSLSKLANLPRLQVFGLTNAVELDRQSISRLKRLRGVNQLVIRDTRIQQGRKRTDFSSLAALDHILRLDLDGTNVTNLDLRSIAKLSLLQDLSLQNTMVDDDAVPFLIKLRNLRALRVNGSKIQDLQALSRQLPNCAINPE